MKIIEDRKYGKIIKIHTPTDIENVLKEIKYMIDEREELDIKLKNKNDWFDAKIYVESLILDSKEKGFSNDDIIQYQLV